MRQILIFSMLVGYSAQAQVVSKFYYNKHWELTTKDSAVYIRTAGYDTLAGVFNGEIVDTYSNGKIQMTGSVFFNIKEGAFKFYYENGQVESSGQYKKNKRLGTWVYFHSNGQQKAIIEFGIDNNRKIISFKDSTGTPLVENGNGKYTETYEIYRVPQKVIVTGALKNHRKHGVWDCSLENGIKLYSDKYHKGEFVKGMIYRDGKTGESSDLIHDNVLEPPYKLFITESFVAAKDVGLEHYPVLRLVQHDGVVQMNGGYSRTRQVQTQASKDAETQSTDDREIFTVVEETASPPGGMGSFYRDLGSEIKVPRALRNRVINTKALIEFVINEDGSITEFSLAKSTGEEALDIEAMRVFALAAARQKWNPGKQRGKPVKQRMVLPVNFHINGS